MTAADPTRVLLDTIRELEEENRFLRSELAKVSVRLDQALEGRPPVAIKECRIEVTKRDLLLREPKEVIARTVETGLRRVAQEAFYRHDYRALAQPPGSDVRLVLRLFFDGWVDR